MTLHHVILLAQGLQDGHVFLNGQQVHSQIPVQAVGEAALQLIPAPGHQSSGEALIGWSSLQ